MKRSLEAEEAHEGRMKERQVEAATWKLQVEDGRLTSVEVGNKHEGAWRERRDEEKDDLKEAHAEVERLRREADKEEPMRGLTEGEKDAAIERKSKEDLEMSSVDSSRIHKPAVQEVAMPEEPSTAKRQEIALREVEPASAMVIETPAGEDALAPQ